MTPKDGSRASEAEPRRAGRLQRALRWGAHLHTRLSQGMTLGVRGVVLDDRARVFLVRHSYTPGWYLPGGGVEVGETLERALARELHEEGAIRLTGPAMLHGLFFNPALAQRDHVAVYIVRDFVVEGPRPPDMEIAEAGFFPLDALPASTTPATRRRLAEITQGSALDANW